MNLDFTLRSSTVSTSYAHYIEQDVILLCNDNNMFLQKRTTL